MKHVYEANIYSDNRNLRKNVATNKNCILRENGLKFQIAKLNILYEIVSWHKQKWLKKELIIRKGLACLVGPPGIMLSFICETNSDYMEPSQRACTVPASQVSELAQFHRIASQADWQNTSKLKWPNHLGK